MHSALICLSAAFAAAEDGTDIAAAAFQRLAAESNTVVTEITSPDEEPAPPAPVTERLGPYEVAVPEHSTQRDRSTPGTGTPEPRRLARGGYPYRRAAPVTPPPSWDWISSHLPSPCPEESCPTGDCPITACCPDFRTHRLGFHFTWLFLSARGADVRYATPVDGLGPAAVPIGPSELVDPAYRSGFRTGLAVPLSRRASLSADFTGFGSHATDRSSLPGGTGFLRADTTHPNTAGAAFDSLAAQADYDVDFQTFDFAFQSIFHEGERHVLNYVLGLRYGHTNQELQARYLILGQTTVDTDIEFHGFGPRVGLTGERMLRGGWHLYGKGSASLLIGNTDADYSQQNVAAGRQALAGIRKDRIVPMLECEIGLGWRSRCGRFRWTGGYYVGSWFNTILTPDFLDAVQLDRFGDLDETLTFDGLALRFEIRL